MSSAAGKSRRTRRLRKRVLIGVPTLICVLFGSLLAWLFAPYWKLSAQLAPRLATPPSRVYGAAPQLERGAAASMAQIQAHLEAGAYRSTASRQPRRGEFHVEGERLVVRLRPSPGPQGMLEERLLGVALAGGRIHRLRLDGQEIERAALEPPLLYTYYDASLRDRWPDDIAALPDHLVDAVLAAEDAGFYRHGGLSPRGIARALWANLRGGEIRQGGSTLTQQLVKNLYLTHERTWSRKFREAVLATLVELRYGKDAILAAYLNEIYWGNRDGVNIMGSGSAARAYFARTPWELTVGQAALLAALIRAPGEYDPARHPERARDRRDWVLERMVALGSLDEEQAARARREPVETVAASPLRRRAPYFAQYLRGEARERFGVDPVVTPGLSLLTTLRLRDQDEAEAAVAWGLESLEEGWEKGSRSGGPLQAALVSADPRDGALLAYVGGRDYRGSQFDRARDAHRQAGSAFKPFVYLSAFELRRATPATLLDDEPLSVQLPTGTWSPGNSDDRHHGWVTARRAVVQSYNVATARMALQTGLPAVVATAHSLGITGNLQPVPALALGAFEVTPLELTTAYATLAAAGRRPTLHGLLAILRAGEPLPGRAVPEPLPAVPAESTFLVTSVLQDVLDVGTATEARRMGLSGPLAGKTGTSNDRRDSWFAGYSPDRVAVVWVGYDDNTPTRLSGSRAGVPIWTRFMHAVRPSGGYREFPQPAGVVTALVDPLSGGLATSGCEQVKAEVFLAGTEPATLCHLHGGGFDPYGEARRGEREGVREGDRSGQPHPFRRWLRRVFGEDQT